MASGKPFQILKLPSYSVHLLTIVFVGHNYILYEPLHYYSLHTYSNPHCPIKLSVMMKIHLRCPTQEPLATLATEHLQCGQHFKGAEFFVLWNFSRFKSKFHSPYAVSGYYITDSAVPASWGKELPSIIIYTLQHIQLWYVFK